MHTYESNDFYSRTKKVSVMLIYQARVGITLLQWIENFVGDTYKVVGSKV